jgi:predicted ATPase
MRITSLAGMGLLSFDEFALPFSKRATFIVGPNGAGKSNTARLLTVAQRAIEGGDGGAADVNRQLASFLAARHVGSQSQAIEVRVGLQLTDAAERTLVIEFVRALVSAALIDRQRLHGQHMVNVDSWASAEITEDKLLPLMTGEIVASHPGTEDGRWECAYEFTATGHDDVSRTYRWVLLGEQYGTIITEGAEAIRNGSDIATRLIGPAPAADAPSTFRLLDLLPHPDLRVVNCSFELSPTPTASQRRFAEMTRLSLLATSGRRMVSLATVLRILFRRALVHTSDQRLLPGNGTSWSSSGLALVDGAEGRLPQLLLLLKNGAPAERTRYQRIRELFTDFTQGRGCEVRLMQVPQAGQDGQPGSTTDVPAVFVTIDSLGAADPLAAEVPIEFAGAGAWEAVVLASVLSEAAASVVILDEPAVALHPSLQRQLGAHLLGTTAQLLVITHSAELLPLADAADVQLVRIDRDDKCASGAHALDEACRVKLTRKLKAKGNERLPFARRAILCEGEVDVTAITAFTERMNIDLRKQNIMVVDCAGRGSIPDYVWFCAELGLKYLAIMDGDANTTDARPSAQAVRDAVIRHQGGELIEFVVDLETTFGVTKPPRGQESRVPDAIRSLAFTNDMPDDDADHPEIVTLAEAIRRLTL